MPSPALRTATWPSTATWPAPVAALALVAALLVPLGPITAVHPLVTSASATSDDGGVCTIAFAFDEWLEAGFGDDGGLIEGLFAAEGVGLVAGRTAGFVVGLFRDPDEEECDEFIQEADLSLFGLEASATFTPPGIDAPLPDNSVQVVLTLSSDDEPVDWADLGGLLDDMGATVTSAAGGSEATVPLAVQDEGEFAVGFFLLELPEDAAGTYRVDLEFLVWEGDVDPDVDDPTRVIEQQLELVIAPPLGLCLATLLIDDDVFDALLLALEEQEMALFAEEAELQDERDELGDIATPSPAEDARIAEIDARLDEIVEELNELNEAFLTLVRDAAVDELEPSTTYTLIPFAAFQFESGCATLFGPDSVFVAADAVTGSLRSIEAMAVDLALERDGTAVDWDALGSGFAYPDTVDDLLESADLDFPERTIELELEVDGATLSTGLVPSLAFFDTIFQVEVEFATVAQPTPGAYTIRTEFLDTTDPGDVRTIGTSSSTRTLGIAGAAQAVIVEVEDIPLEITVTESTVTLSVRAGEVVASDDPLEETAGVVRITTPSGAGTIHEVGFLRSAGGGDLGELSLVPVIGDLPAVLNAPGLGVGVLAASGITGPAEHTAGVMVNGLPGALSDVELPLRWQLSGTAPSAGTTIANTVIFTIAESTG